MKDNLDFAIYKKVINEVLDYDYAIKLTDEIMNIIKDHGLIKQQKRNDKDIK